MKKKEGRLDARFADNSAMVHSEGGNHIVLFIRKCAELLLLLQILLSEGVVSVLVLCP